MFDEWNSLPHFYHPSFYKRFPIHTWSSYNLFYEQNIFFTDNKGRFGKAPPAPLNFIPKPTSTRCRCLECVQLYNLRQLINRRSQSQSAFKVCSRNNCELRWSLKMNSTVNGVLLKTAIFSKNFLAMPVTSKKCTMFMNFYLVDLLQKLAKLVLNVQQLLSKYF